MKIVNSVVRKTMPKIENSLDAACNSYIMNVIGALKGTRKGNPLAGLNYQKTGGKVLPTHPKMKGAKVSQEAMDSFHEAQAIFGENPYGLTKDGVPIVSIFESSDTAVDAMGRAVLLKKKPPVPKLPTPPYIPRPDYEYAYAT